jgi:endonuclease YncB( thermonuclease family)
VVSDTGGDDGGARSRRGAEWARLASRAGWRAALVPLLAVALAACEPFAGAPSRPAAAPAGEPSRAGVAGAPGPARRAEATVTRVADGDSLVVSFGDGRRGDVRLHGIDAPELAQAGGPEARDHLRRLALGRRVELQLQGVDPYGRHLAVAIAEPGDLGLLQIESGHAWHNVRYAREQEASRRERYAGAERAARVARRGLWAAAAPVAPWDYKAAERGGAADGRVAPSAGGRGGEARGAPGTAEDRAGRVVANRRSGLYHLPGCPGHGATSGRNAVLFASEDAARQAGYRRAPNC